MRRFFIYFIQKKFEATTTSPNNALMWRGEPLMWRGAYLVWRS